MEASRATRSAVPVVKHIVADYVTLTKPRAQLPAAAERRSRRCTWRAIRRSRWSRSPPRRLLTRAAPACSTTTTTATSTPRWAARVRARCRGPDHAARGGHLRLRAAGGVVALLLAANARSSASLASRVRWYMLVDMSAVALLAAEHRDRRRRGAIPPLVGGGGDRSIAPAAPLPVRDHLHGLAVFGALSLA